MKFTASFLRQLPLVLSCLALPLEAAYTLKNGKLMDVNEVATLSVQEHYSAAMDAYQKKDWEEVLVQSTIVLKNFQSTPFAQEIPFFMGVAYFHLDEYESANNFFTDYLKKQATPKFFEEAIQYKFKIAEGYQSGGVKKHVLGWSGMPKWVPAREDAIAIYDEVITALPHHELAAQALFGKAVLLLKDEEYKSSIDTYQTLIRRFHKHSLAAESYIGIGKVYLIQCQKQYPDQDFLDLAEINLRKFRQDFPRDEKTEIANQMLGEMREVYASDLYDTARFYERTKKTNAASLYYTRILAKFPETQVAKLATKRLGKLEDKKPPSASLPDEEVNLEVEPLIDSPLNHLPVTGQIVDAS